MHKRSLGTRPIRTAALAALLGAALGTAAPARFGPPPPPGPRPSTAASAPLPALAAGLRLSAAQQAKVAQIQAQFGRRRRALMPLPPGGGPPPDPGSLRAAWGRMRVLDQSADADIGAALTGPQRADLPALLRTLDALRTAGIPPATYGALKLSASQTARLTVLVHTSRRATGRAMDAARRSGDFGSVRASMRSVRKRLAAQAAAVLTPAQRNTVDSYKAAHPRPPGGGPGGFGPPPLPEERHSRDEDHGRPVVLVARDLGVTPDQFRAASRKVHPAGAGQESTEAERRANRKVLSERLGVPPERLDAVMDKSRAAY